MSKDKIKQMARAHQRYYLADGTLVPGSTTVTGLLNKPALILWANQLGLQGIDSSKYVDAAARVGTLIHSMVEHHIKKEELDTSEYSAEEIDLAKNGLLKYFEWEEQHTIEPIFNEYQMVSEKYRYGGTCDFYCILDGKKTLVDFKSGKGIYNEHFLQVSSYANLLEEQGYEVEQILILNIGRSENENFLCQIIDKATTLRYFEMFKHLLEVYWIKKELKWY